MVKHFDVFPYIVRMAVGFLCVIIVSDIVCAVHKNDYTTHCSFIQYSQKNVGYCSHEHVVDS